MSATHPTPETASRARAPRAAWIALVLTAFVLRVLVVRAYEASHPNAELLAIDEAAYDAWAKRIAAGDWLGGQVFFQEPLYPYALGVVYRVFGAEHLLVRLLQAALGALLCLGVGKLAERLFGRAAGLASGALLAVYAPLVLYPCFLLKEAVFVPLLALVFVLLARTRERESTAAWIALGVLGGLGALLRGNVLVLLPFLVFLPLARAWRSRAGGAWRRALACAAGVVLVLAPVLWRNHAIGGAWVLTTAQTGTNLYAGNNAENPFGRAYEVGFVRGVPEHEADDWRREAERRAGRPLDAAETSAFWRDATLASALEAPALHARILWNKLRLTLGADEVPDDHAFAWDVRYVPLLDGPWPGFGMLGALGLAGLAWHALQRARGKRPPSAADELGIVFALYLATIVLTVTSDRARLPLVPMLAPFAATFALELLSTARALAWSRLGGLVLLLGASAAFVLVPALPASERAEDLDERDFNLAGLLARDPARIGEARALAAGLVQRHPESRRAELLALGLELENARAMLGDPGRSARSGARAAAERVAGRLAELAREARDVPGRALTPREAHRLARLTGDAELLRGGYAAARDAYTDAARFDPDDDGTALGRALAELGLADGETDHDAALARIRAAEELLLPLRANEAGAPRTSAGGASASERTRSVELAWSAAEFARGRLELVRGGADAVRSAQTAFANALRALQPIAKDETTPPGERARARRLAGRVQLAIGTDDALASAENHFRAARALVDEPESTLGLAQVLVTRAERAAQGRDERVREATSIVDALALLDAANPAVLELRARLERLATGPR